MAIVTKDFGATKIMADERWIDSIAEYRRSYRPGTTTAIPIATRYLVAENALVFTAQIGASWSPSALIYAGPFERGVMRDGLSDEAMASAVAWVEKRAPVERQ